MRIKTKILALLASFTFFGTAQAATVDAVTSLELDYAVTGTGGGDLTYVGLDSVYACEVFTVDCANIFNDVIFEFAFGSSLNGDDLGTVIVDGTTAGVDLSGIGGVASLSGLPEMFFVHASLIGGSVDAFTAITLAVEFGDRFFSFDPLQLEPPLETPLPAALPLFFAGIAGLGFTKRKKAGA